MKVAVIALKKIIAVILNLMKRRKQINKNNNNNNKDIYNDMRLYIHKMYYIVI